MSRYWRCRSWKAAAAEDSWRVARGVVVKQGMQNEPLRTLVVARRCGGRGGRGGRAAVAERSGLRARKSDLHVSTRVVVVCFG